MKTARSVALILVLFLVILVVPSQGGNPLTILHSFSGGLSGDGGEPQAGLIQEGSTLYGVTTYGGASGFGTVFSMNTDGNDYRILHSFSEIDDGNSPIGSLLLSDSRLYGLTWWKIYSINTDGSDFRIVHTFSGNEGSPVGSLILSGSTLYGVTTDGGEMSMGTVFSVNTNGSNFRTLHSFAEKDGANTPAGRLTIVGSTLYGMTMFDDISGSGAIFSINTNGSNFRILHFFSERWNEGLWPANSFILSESALYGLTTYGGRFGGGTIFLINTDGSGFRVLHSFAGSPGDGSVPNGSLIQSGSTLYGTTMFGGSSDSGTIFSIGTDGSNFRILHSFPDTATDPSSPWADLIVSDSMLYGTTFMGGNVEHGTVFAFSLDDTRRLNVTKSGSGAVKSSPSRMYCGPVCSASFTSGTTVTLTPVPDSGFVFTGWTGGCKGTGMCSVIMTADITVGATFEAGSCAYAISSNAKTVTYRGGTITVGITAKDHTFCAPPEIINTTGWITHTATPLTKNKGSVKLEVPASDSSIGRVSAPDALTIGGNALTVSQTGKPCSFSLIPAVSPLFPQAGDTGTFDVKTTPTDCTWKAVPDGKSTWITIDSGGEGADKGAVGYTVAANGTGKARTGKIVVTVNGKSKSHIVRQGK